MEDNCKIVLSERDFKALLDLIAEEREPNDKFKKAVEMHKKQVEPSDLSK